MSTHFVIQCRRIFHKPDMPPHRVVRVQLAQRSLDFDLAILLDVNVFAGLEDVDVVIRIFDPGSPAMS
jgi:hypothetical protein